RIVRFGRRHRCARDDRNHGTRRRIARRWCDVGGTLRCVDRCRWRIRGARSHHRPQVEEQRHHDDDAESEQHAGTHAGSLAKLCRRAPAPRMTSITTCYTLPSMTSIVSIQGLSKTYDRNHFVALKRVDLEIERGEIFALLGPNGAGKTTLINIVCGIVTPSTGTVIADGHDIVRDFRGARSKIGLVPQELST